MLAILEEVENRIAMPLQLLSVAEVVIHKKDFDTRTIAIMSTFSRMLMRYVAPEVRAWDKQAALQGDSAR